MGQPEQSFDLIERAIRLSQRDPQFGVWPTFASMKPMLNPEYGNLLVLAQASALAGRREEAIAALPNAMRLLRVAQEANVQTSCRCESGRAQPRRTEGYRPAGLTGVPAPAAFNISLCEGAFTCSCFSLPSSRQTPLVRKSLRRPPRPSAAYGIGTEVHSPDKG